MWELVFQRLLKVYGDIFHEHDLSVINGKNVFEYKIKHVDNSSVKTNETFIIIIKQKNERKFCCQSTLVKLV